MEREPTSDIRDLGPRRPSRVLERAVLALAVVAAAALSLWALGVVLDAVLLAFAGALLAVLLRGLSDWLSRRTRLPERAAFIAVVTAIAALTGAGAWLLWPSISAQLGEIAGRLPGAIESLRGMLEGTALGRLLTSALSAEGGGVLRTSQGAPRLLSTAAGAAASFIVVLFVGLFFAAEPRLYRRGVLRLVPIARRARAAEIFGDLGHVLRRFLVGRLISMIFVGVFTWIGLALLDIPLAMILGILVGAWTFAPYAGPLLGTIPVALVALAEGPTRALHAISLYAVVQLTEGYIIAPLVQRRAASLPPALILLSQVVLGLLGGALGIALATPLLAVILVLTTRIYVQDVLGDDTVTSREANAPLPGLPEEPRRRGRRRRGARLRRQLTRRRVHLSAGRPAPARQGIAGI